MRDGLAGGGLTALAALVGVLAAGTPGAIGAAAGGLVATLVQLGAGRLMQGQREAAFARFMARWAMGTGLRIAGILAVVALVLVDRTLFAPLPTALGYLGVLLPLLALETRTVQRW